jgi:hypothetical protein
MHNRYGMLGMGATLLILAGTLCVPPAVSGKEASWGIAQKPEPRTPPIQPLRPVSRDALCALGRYPLARPAPRPAPVAGGLLSLLSLAGVGVFEQVQLS